MARNKRYAMSGGLAFSEQGDMNKLSRFAAQGWLLESFAPLGYFLRRGTPAQLDYCVDYHEVAPQELDGYSELFQAGGWTRVCSVGDIHIFSAPKGTKPIYTDMETNREKYVRNVRNLRPFLSVPAATVGLITLLAAAHLLDAAGWILHALFALMTIGAALGVPILMTYAASRLRLNRMSRKR